MPRLALIQSSAAADPDTNVRSTLERIQEAGARGAEIICLQELFRSHYFCQEENADLFELAESIPGPTTEALSQAAKATGAVIVGSVFERRAAGVYHNTAVVFDADGEMLGLYRKMHIPDDPLFYEKFYFTPGDLGFRVFETRYGKVAPLVCWDQWYPEAARLAALAGAELLVYPTAIGWHPAEKDEWGDRQCEAWRVIQRSHAVANGVYVAAVNRTGLEQPVPGRDGIEFWGRSFVAGPLGDILAEADEADELVFAELDFSRIEETRRGWPFLRDRRIDAYGDLTRRLID